MWQGAYCIIATLITLYNLRLLLLIQDEFLQSPIDGRKSTEASTLPEGSTDTFFTAQCGLFNSESTQIDDPPTHPISFHSTSTDSHVLGDQSGLEDELPQSCSDSQWLLPQRTWEYGHCGYSTVETEYIIITLERWCCDALVHRFRNYRPPVEAFPRCGSFWGRRSNSLLPKREIIFNIYAHVYLLLYHWQFCILYAQI